MKNVKKTGITLILVAVLVVGAVIGVVASNTKYTGNIDRLETLVQAALDADTVALKEEALVAAEEYVTTKPVDPETEGYDEVAELYVQARLGGVDLYISSMANTNGDTDMMISYAERADYWFKSVFKTDNDKADSRYAEYLDKVHTSNMVIADLLCEAVDEASIAKADADSDTVKADSQYKIAKTFFDKRCFNTNAGDYTALAAEVARLEKLYLDSKAARYLALIAEARMDDYGVNPIYQNSFEGTTSGLSVSNATGYDENGLALKNTYGKVTEQFEDGSTNTYFEININGARNQANTSYVSTYFTLSFGGTSDRFILEMDFTSNTTLPNSGIYFQSRPSAGTNTWMQINSKGDILDHNGAVIAERAIVPGEWTHISIVCEIENIKQSRLYLDYAYAGIVNGDHKGYDYIPENMRIGNKTNKSGQMCIDNVYISFNGSFCKQDYLDLMVDLDKFIYLSDYMQHTGADEIFINIPDCISAYDKAKELIDTFAYKKDDGSIVYKDTINALEDEAKKEAAKKAVNDFYSYDPTEIIINYKKENLAEYKALVDALKAIDKAPTSTSINKRNSQVTKIQKFIAAAGSYIFVAGDDNAPITAGSGTVDDPYILTHGAHLFDNTAATGGNWVYYSYTAKDAGTLKFTSTTEGAVIGYLDGAGDVVEITDPSKSVTLDVGDTVVFAIKPAAYIPPASDADESAAVQQFEVTASFNLEYNYDDILTEYSGEVARIEQDQAISKFISTMDGFDKATSATLLQSRYDAATALIEDGLNTALLGDGTDGDPYAAFYKHYHVTYANAPAKIEAAKKAANSKDIIAAINYLLSTYPDEEDWKLVYIENPVTDEDKASNERYTFIESYVVLIRGRLKGGNYDPDYVAADGTTIDIMVQRFEAMNDHYYQILQGQHVDHISEKLDVFAASTSYIEKKGIISYVQRYLNKEDVDFSVQLVCQNEKCSACGEDYDGEVKDVAAPACPICGEIATSYRLVSSNADIAEIIQRYSAYEAELEPQKEDYDAMLNQNTVYFLNAVKKFDTAITYVDKLALLNEAMPFYYAMNIGDEEVLEGIAKYDALAAELAVVQENSKSFIENVLLIAPSLEEYGINEYYAQIVEAATLRDKVDNSIDGVSEAIEIFEKEVAAYEAVTDTVNDEIKESANVLGSFGANCGLTAVISVVLKRLFSFE